VEPEGRAVQSKRTLSERQEESAARERDSSDAREADRPDAREPEGQDSPQGLSVNSDLIELLRVMPRVFRGLRRSGEQFSDASPPSEGFRALFKDGTLGPRHIPVLVVLVLEGPQTVGDLARRVGLNLATVSLMAGELAKAGLVERHEDERDRRRTLVSIPQEHCWRLAPFVGQRIAPVRRALERMSPEVREAFLAGWRVLADEIERGTPGVSERSGRLEGADAER
jgi:DNA-binding MarR family transcriptional regulator